MPPIWTVLGLAVLVTARSQTAMTGVVMLVLLLAELGSLVVEETEEAAVIEVAVTLVAKFTTTTMFADVAEAMVEAVHVTDVVVVQDQPAGADTETNVVFEGIASVKVGVVAAPGPLFVTVCM